jgi:hypothetical protein
MVTNVSRIVTSLREKDGTGSPYIFRSYDHHAEPAPNGMVQNPGGASNVPIWQVARATTAAPGYLGQWILMGGNS